jgi:hypothetical protein
MKAYENPTVVTLGKVAELTASVGEPDKCHGSGDTAFPDILENKFSTECQS